MAEPAIYKHSIVSAWLANGEYRASHGRLLLRLTIELTNHAKGKPCTVHLFMRRSLQGLSELHGSANGRIGHPLDVECWIPRTTVSQNEKLYIWVYTERRIRGDEPFDVEGEKSISNAVAGRARLLQLGVEDVDAKKLLVRTYLTRVGEGEIGLHELVNGLHGRKSTKSIFGLTNTDNPRTGELVWTTWRLGLTNIDNERVGEAVWRTLVYEDTHKSLRFTGTKSDSADLEVAKRKLLAEVTAYEKSIPGVRKTSETNITGIPLRLGGGVPLPCGRAPMWALPWMLTQRSYHGPKFEETLLCWLQAAASSMFVSPDFPLGQRSVPALAELIAEMQLVNSRACMYVPDTVLDGGGKSHKTDEWEYMNNQLDPQRRKVDCEDASFNVMENHWIFTHAEFKDPRLLVLQALERKYVACMCLGTMRTSPTGPWFYHIFVMKFDRRFIERLADVKLDASSPAEDAQFLPPVLLESTTYTTSCWKLSDGVGPNFAADSDVWVTSCLISPVENMAKAPASIVRSSGNYGHVITMFVPELMHVKSQKFTEKERGRFEGITQLELKYNGRVGVPTDVLMDMQLSNVECAPMGLDTSMRKAVFHAFDFMPAVPFLHTYASDFKQQSKLPTTAAACVAKHGPQNLAFSAWYRLQDRTPDVLKAISIAAPGTKHSYSLQFEFGFGGSLVHEMRFF